MNVETLRIRLEDAVNTIIRREDGDEKGSYLMPCVEAALALGCTPKKTPRGHRQGFARHTLKRSISTSADPANGVPAGENCTSGHVNASEGMMQVSVSSSTLCSQGIEGQLGAPVQAQILHTPLVSPCSGVGVCYISDAIPRTFLTPHEISDILPGSSLPSYGLQGFPRAPDARRPIDYPAPENAGPYTRMLTNLNQESLEVRNSRARMDLRPPCVNPHGALASSVARSPVSTISTMCRAESYPKAPLRSGQNFGNIAAEGMDFVRSNLTGNDIRFMQSHFQPQMSSRPLSNYHSSLVSELGESPPSHRPQVRDGIQETACALGELPIQNTPPTLACVDNENAACPVDAHDLQLRLGPPGDQPVLYNTRTVFEQVTSSSRHFTEGASIASWENHGKSIASGRNYISPPQRQTCKKLDVSVCNQMWVPEPKRPKGNAVVADSFSSACENRLHMGSTLPPEQIKWPR